MNPFLYGGDMIDYVFEDEVTFKNFMKHLREELKMYRLLLDLILQLNI